MHTKQVQELNIPRLHYKTVSDLVGALRQCSKRKDLERGKELHADAVEASCHTDKYVASALIRMYMKCSDTQLAQDVFDGMIHRDIVTWNSLILGYVQNEDSSTAMHLFTIMDFEPDSYTYVAVLQACASLAGKRHSVKEALLEKGIAIHTQVKERGLDPNIVVSNTLVDMYSKCGSMHHAREVFERMLHKDVVSWTCLILGYVENGESSVGIELFDKMDVEPDSFTHAAALKAYTCLAGETHTQKRFCLEKGMAIHMDTKHRGFDSNTVVATALVDMYSKCGCMDLAGEVFDTVKTPTVIMWNCLMMGYVENGQSSVALEILARMNSEPDHGTYVVALTGCGNLASLSAGELLHGIVCKLGLEQEQVMATTLVDFYGKCGSMAKSEVLFDSMCSPNIVSWTALIQGYAALGESSRVFALVENLQNEGLRLDNITHRCILTACSHSGMVDEGKSYFRSIIRPTVEHYTCVIDMLGRANRLEEALSVAKTMPYDAVMWTSLLAACRKFKNVLVGKAVYDELVANGSANAAVYVLMSDIYAKRGDSGRVFILKLTGNNEHWLSPTLISDLHAAVDEVHDSPEAGCLVTTNEGHFFSNGLDLSWMDQDPQVRYPFLLHRLELLTSQFMKLNVPTVAAVCGHAAAGGLLLALAHDHRIMRADRGYLYSSAVDIGIMLPPGCLALMRAKMDAKAYKDVVLSGVKLTGEAACSRGLVDGFYEDSDKTIQAAIAEAEKLADRGWNKRIYPAVRQAMYPDVIEKLGLEQKDWFPGKWV